MTLDSLDPHFDNIIVLAVNYVFESINFNVDT